MNRTVEQSAQLVAVVLNRSAQSRARLSAKTIKLLARRSHLRSAFVVDLTTMLADRHEWIMFELASGGFGAVQSRALEAAKPVTAKRLFTERERRDLRLGRADWEALADEAAALQEIPDDED